MVVFPLDSSLGSPDGSYKVYGRFPPIVAFSASCFDPGPGLELCFKFRALVLVSELPQLFGSRPELISHSFKIRSLCFDELWVARVRFPLLADFEVGLALNPAGWRKIRQVLRDIRVRHVPPGLGPP